MHSLTLFIAVIEKKEGDTLTIEAIEVPQKKENLLIDLKSNACPLCALGLDVKHTVSSVIK